MKFEVDWSRIKKGWQLGGGLIFNAGMIDEWVCMCISLKKQFDHWWHFTFNQPDDTNLPGYNYAEIQKLTWKEKKDNMLLV